MGEDVHEYEYAVQEEEAEEEEEDEDSSSFSSDGFLEIPFNDLSLDATRNGRR